MYQKMTLWIKDKQNQITEIISARVGVWGRFRDDPPKHLLPGWVRKYAHGMEVFSEGGAIRFDLAKNALHALGADASKQTVLPRKQERARSSPQSNGWFPALP